MRIAYKFGNLKGLRTIAYLILSGGIFRSLFGLYDFFNIQAELDFVEKFDFMVENALLFGINGLILFLVLKWIAEKLKEKDFELSLK